MSGSNLELARNVSIDIALHFMGMNNKINKVVTVLQTGKGIIGDYEDGTALSKENFWYDTAADIIIPDWSLTFDIIADFEKHAGIIPNTAKNKIIDGLKRLPEGSYDNLIEDGGINDIMDGISGLPRNMWEQIPKSFAGAPINPDANPSDPDASPKDPNNLNKPEVVNPDPDNPITFPPFAAGMPSRPPLSPENFSSPPRTRPQ